MKPIVRKNLNLVPAKPGTCPECATEHSPDEPHNRDSLYYQMRFYLQHRRSPSWDDAMAHCDAETKALWHNTLADCQQLI